MSGRRRRTPQGWTQVLHGIGLHSGKPASLMLGTGEPGTGIVFRRGDLRHAPDIPARAERIVPAERCTALGLGGVTVRTVEHVLAACVFAGVDDAVVSVEGEEVPGGDGSAAPFLELLTHVGLTELDAPVEPLVLGGRVELTGGAGAGWRITAEPAERPSFVFRFRGGGTLDGAETAYTPGVDDGVALAAARTFCFESEIPALRARGLGAGGSLDNVVVLRADGGAVNPERMPREAVRHKLLDLVGDLALAGGPVAARITGEGSGHAAHAAFLNALLPKLVHKEVPINRA